MANEGTGKIKLKRTHTPKKPYDRSTSFLGKIKDSVKDLLIPSWMTGSPNSASESSEGRVPSKPTSQFALSSDTINGPQAQSLSLRQSTSSDADHVSQLNEMQSHQSLLQTSTSGPGRLGIGGKLSGDKEGPAPNVNIAALEQQNISWHEKEKESSISRLTHAFQMDTKKKSVDPAHLRMSDSYLEESIDSASNTAPSQIMMSTSVVKNTSKSDASRLWSYEVAKLRRGLLPPVKDKPAFNAFLFASSSKTTEGLGDSSFYSGKTCYGGSSARRRKAMNTSLPYQSSLPLRKQVTANKLNSSLNATTSSTAQRILETLDRMSTPLGDAKKIPQEASTSDSVISFTPSSYRRTSSIGSMRSATRPLQLPSRGPPISQHKALLQVELARNRNKIAALDKRQSTDTNSEFIVSQNPSAAHESLKSAISMEQQSFQAPAIGNTGKLKSKKFSQHVSNRKDEDEEVPVAPNLRTDFTLPISNINPIIFSTQSTKIVTSMASSTPSKHSAPTLKFTFSTPIEGRRPSSNQTPNHADQDFKFSSPIKASKSNAVGAEEGSKISPEPAVGASSALPATSFSMPAWGSTAPKSKHVLPDIGGTSSSFKSYSKWSGFSSGSSAAPDISSPANFSLAPVASPKSGSVMDILGGKSSSPGGAALVTGKSHNGVDDLMAKFRKPAGTWECDTCMLSNKPEAVKCIACEASKPGAQPTIPLSTGVSKGLPLQQTDDLMAKFKKPPGTWECDACMLANKPEANKCIACETPRPGGASVLQSTVSKKPESSTAAVAFASEGGFVFSSLPSTTATASSNFKFGNSGSSSTSTNLPTPSGFVFGETGLSTSASSSIPSTSSGFKFGSTAITSTGSNFGVAVSSQSSPASGFTFGNLNKTSTSLSDAAASSQFDRGQNSTKKDSVSAEVEVTQSGMLNSNTNGFSFNVDNTKSTSSGLAFSGMSAAPAFSPLTNFTPPTQQNATSQPASNFNMSTVTTTAPQLSAATPDTSILTNAKAASGLFQFGATPAGSLVNNSIGLGMGPSLANSKALVNGEFGAPSFKGHTDSTSGGVQKGASTFGGFGQNNTSFSSSLQGPNSSLQGQTNKRVTDLEEAEPPSAKKMFNFGSTNKESAPNGGFHFGGAAQSSTPGFGSAAAASAPAPTGGFTFGLATKTTAPQPSGPAGGGGFQFSNDTANTSFNYAQAAAAAKPTFESSAPATSFKVSGLPTNFSFGGVSQSSSAPFQFGGKPAESAASAAVAFAAPQAPQLNGSGFGGAPSGMGSVGSFNVGVGESSQRKFKRGVRRIRK